jgi:hypothetical protein
MTSSFSSFSSSYSYNSNPFEENETVLKSQNVNGKSKFEIHKKRKTPNKQSGKKPLTRSANFVASSSKTKPYKWDVTMQRNTPEQRFKEHHAHVNSDDELRSLWRTISSHFKNSKLKEIQKTPILTQKTQKKANNQPVKSAKRTKPHHKL